MRILIRGKASVYVKGSETGALVKATQVSIVRAGLCQNRHKQRRLLGAYQCTCVFSVSLLCASGLGWDWGGGGYKVETNSSLGDEGRHNYVQFSS